MTTTNHLYEFGGDPTQPLPNIAYRFKKEIFPKRVKPAFARIIFDEGDLDDFNEWVTQRQIVVRRVNQVYAESEIDGSGGRVGGGFWFGYAPISGVDVPDTVTVNGVEYDLETVPLYAGPLTLQFKVYKNGVLAETFDVSNSKPFRLGLSGRDTTWQFEINGNVEHIKRIDIASSMQELTQIDETE